MNQRTDTVIVGAGIAGIAAAYYLARSKSRRKVLLVDRGPPMAYTTSKSGENFRAYWPQRCMADLCSRSHELMLQVARDSGSPFKISETGYDFVSQQRNSDLFQGAQSDDKGVRASLTRITDRRLLAARFPYLSHETRQVVRIADAGSVDVHALGSAMLAEARKYGVRLLNAEIMRINPDKQGFSLEVAGGNAPVHARELVLCAGPMTPSLAAQLGVQMDVHSFLQRKFVLPDPLRAIPGDMPFTIFADPQVLDWSEEERSLISEDPEYQWLLETFPPGLHIKPEPGGRIKLGWAFNREASEPCWQPADDFDFPNITLRGASRMIPALRPYLEQLPTPIIQYSGYYSRTPENWPIIGALGDIDGLYTIAALSGFGTMAACAAGELLAARMDETELPAYAPFFAANRRSDPQILAEIESSASDGQL